MQSAQQIEGAHVKQNIYWQQCGSFVVHSLEKEQGFSGTLVLTIAEPHSFYESRIHVIDGAIHGCNLFVREFRKRTESICVLALRYGLHIHTKFSA